jgi:non-ribosomal peptide synthetase component F
MSGKDVEAIYPLSPQQQGMLLESLYGDSGLHVEQISCALTGELDETAFEEAWRRLLDRHSILRTAFAWKNRAEPLQVVFRRVNPPIERLDWRGLPAPEIAARARELADAERRRGFDLTRAPLLRVTLARTGEDAYRLVWTHHHLLLDGWCRPILLDELTALYASLVHGRGRPLPPSRPYRDYIAWLRARQQDSSGDESFWRRELAGFSRPTPLGAAETAPGPDEGRSGGSGQRVVRVPAPTVRALRGVAQGQQVTPGTVVQGLWALLLGRYSGDRDVIFGITVAGRPSELAGVESMVGLFISSLPLRVRTDPDRLLWPWLREVQARSLELRSREHCSPGQIHNWSEVPGKLPLYWSLLAFESRPPAQAPAAEAGGLRLDLGLSALSANGGRTRHPLTLLVAEDSGLELVLLNDRRHLDDASADRIARHLASLLETASAGGEPRLADLLSRVPQEEIPRHRHPAEGSERPTAAPPDTETERTVAQVWEEILGVEGVGRESNFFELNGHSLLAIRLSSRLAERLGLEVPLRVLFESPTLAGMAAWIDGQRHSQEPQAPAAEAVPSIEPDRAGRFEPFPLSDIQRAYLAGRGGLLHLDGGANLYLELTLDGVEDFPVEPFDAVVRKLFARHDMLRMVLLPEGGQRVLPDAPPYRTRVVDLRGEAPDAVEELLERERERLRSSCGESGHPLEFVFHRLEGGRLHIHLRMDALVADGTSREILMRELFALLGGAEEPPPLALTFRDYVLAKLAFEKSPTYLRSREYWMRRLPGLPPQLEPPLIRPLDPGIRSRLERRAAPVLSPDAWQQLKKRAAQAGLTPSALAISAFARALFSWSRSDAFLLPLVGSHRLPVHPHVDQLVGNFNTLHLLAVEAAADSFEAFARRIRQQLAADLENRYFSGFEVLRELGRLHGPSAAPAPVLFNSIIEYSHPKYGPPRSAGAARSRPAEEPGLRQVETGLYPPRVLLLVVMSENRHGALECESKAVRQVFEPGAVEALLAAYQDLLARLAAGEDAWREPVPPPAPRVLHVSRPAEPAPFLACPGVDGRDLEARLSEIWEELLGTRPERPTDSFFALGGDSLTATLLKMRVADEFGCDAVTPAFLTQPTLEALAQRLRAGGAVMPGPAPAETFDHQGDRR